MTKLDLIRRFEELSLRANAYNKKHKNKNKRFYPMSQLKYGKTVSLGMYDYEKKKYTLINVKSVHLEKTISEISTMLDNA